MNARADRARAARAEAIELLLSGRGRERGQHEHLVELEARRSMERRQGHARAAGAGTVARRRVAGGEHQRVGELGAHEGRALAEQGALPIDLGRVENATSRSYPQPSHRMRVKPWASTLQRRYPRRVSST